MNPTRETPWQRALREERERVLWEQDRQRAREQDRQQTRELARRQSAWQSADRTETIKRLRKEVITTATDPTGTTRLTAEELLELSSRLSDMPEDPETGWRFGGVTQDGAIKSPFVPRMPLPPAGLHAVCLFGISSGLRLGIRARLDHVPPEPLCKCGLFYVTELADLLEYFSPDWPDEAVTRVRRRTHGLLSPAMTAPDAMKSRHNAIRRGTQVVYEVEAWGGTTTTGTDRTVDGETRASDLRVKPGGRIYLHKSRAQHADTLAGMYGAEVIVGTADGKLAWLEEIRTDL